MKTFILVTPLLALLASATAYPQSEDYPDTNGLLRKMGLEELAAEQVAGDVDDNDADTYEDGNLAEVMQALDEDGEGSVMAQLLTMDEDKAVARLQFFHHIWRVLKS